MRTLALVLTLVTLAGCKIGDTVYQAPGGDDGGDGPVVDAPVDAPDGIHVQVTPANPLVAEGGQVTVQVRLSEAPPADRLITVQTDALIDATPATLTFTPDNWNVNRTVILAAAQDDDAADSPSTVVFSGDGAVGDGLAMVMITDDDTLSMIVSPPTSIGVTENGSGTLSVALTAQPTGTVAIAVATTDTAIAGVTPGQLSFNAANWYVPQTVMVTGTQDVDTMDDSTELVFDPVLEGIPPHSVQVNVTDTGVLAIDVMPTSLTVTEAAGTGHQGSIMVRLTRAPGGTKIVTAAATPGGKVALANATLTFDDANYDTFQTVTVTAQDDVDVAAENVTVALTAADVADRFVQVAVVDDDEQVIEVTPATVPDLDENQAMNLSVRLRYRPSGTVAVDVDSGDPARLTLGANQLVFTPSDYDTAQIVRITALDDVDLADHTVPVSFNASAQSLTTVVGVTIDDDDTQTIEVSPVSLGLAEGTSGQFGVRLLYQPAGTVTVTVMTTSTQDVGLSPMSLSFGPGDYDQPKAVTVMALQDPDTANENVSVTVASAGLTPRTVAVAISDDDTLGIVVSPASIAVTEGNATGQVLMVSLGAMPAGNVTVNLTTLPAGVASLASSQLTFTQANYATPQPVRVTGTQDADGADETTTITLAASGLDNKTVPVSVTDDEVITPVFSANPVTITEGKPDSRFTVALNVDPGRAVTVEIQSIAFLDFEVSPVTYNFNSTNWSQGQTITLHAFEDDTADNETESVPFTVVGEGSATLTVNTSDPTILVGFPPSHNPGLPIITVNGLEAYSDGTLPVCWVLDKLKVDIASSAGGASIKVGLYTDGLGKPGLVYWEDIPRTVVNGVQEYTINQPFGAAATGIAWVVVEATTGVTFRTKPNYPSTRCRRPHIFGQAFPNPFDGGIVTPPLDGGTDAGGGLDCVQGQAPPAIWLIGHPSDSCVEPA